MDTLQPSGPSVGTKEAKIFEMEPTKEIKEEKGSTGEDEISETAATEETKEEEKNSEKSTFRSMEDSVQASNNSLNKNKVEISEIQTAEKERVTGEDEISEMAPTNETEEKKSREKLTSKSTEVGRNKFEISEIEETEETPKEKSTSKDEISEMVPTEEIQEKKTKQKLTFKSKKGRYKIRTSESDSAEETEKEKSTSEDEIPGKVPVEETEEKMGSKKPTFKSTEDVLRELVKKKSMKERQEDLARYRQLYKGLSHRNWPEVEDFINDNPDALTVIIAEHSQTFFHIIAGSDQDGAFRLLNKYLTADSKELLEKKDSFGCTALSLAAKAGNTKVAKYLVEVNPKSLEIKDNGDLLPLHHAAGIGHKETVKYLLSMTSLDNSDTFASVSGFSLVKALVEANLYDVAFDLLKRHPKLARDDLFFRRQILETLAKKPKGFESGSRLRYWQCLIYPYVPVRQEDFDDGPQTQNNDFSPAEGVTGDTENPIQGSQNYPTISSPFSFFRALRIMLWKVLMHLAPIRYIHDVKLMHRQTVEIVRMMCAKINWGFEEAFEALKMPILTAARLGITEIVIEIIMAYPDSAMFVDEDGNNIIMLAVLHRQEKVFKLLSQIGGIKELEGIYMRNKNGNNILHLAALSVAARELPGAALQMQRELQWFKAVEKYVQPSVHEYRNDEKKTPRELFSEKHEQLIEKGEKWMRNNASSCALVASLIITVVFAAAFTLPGDYNADGIPILLHQVAFKIFVISDALALFSSTTSLLMFLGILTTRYPEEDFLVSLPRKLIIGLITLFFSIASMNVAFGATIYIVLSHPWKWIIIPIVLLCCLPVILFALLQFPLWHQIYSSTYAPTISQPVKNLNLYV